MPEIVQRFLLWVLMCFVWGIQGILSSFEPACHAHLGGCVLMAGCLIAYVWLWIAGIVYLFGCVLFGGLATFARLLMPIGKLAAVGGLGYLGYLWATGGLS
jgi:hypothetical protein